MSGDRYKISDQNAMYFTTFTVVNWIDVFTREDYRLEIVESLNYCIVNKDLTVYALCIMSNHLHFIIQVREGYNLSAMMILRNLQPKR